MTFSVGAKPSREGTRGGWRREQPGSNGQVSLAKYSKNGKHRHIPMGKRKFSARGVQEGSKTAQERPKRPQDRPRPFQDGLRWLQDGPRGPRDGSRGFQEDIREGFRRLTTLIFLRFLKVFWVLCFSGQERPKTAQEFPNIVPRLPNWLPRKLQHGPRGPQ